MKFTDGFWKLRDGVTALYAQEAYDIDAGDGRLVITAPTKVIERRGDTLNRTVLTVTLTSPLPGVIGVLVEHHQGGAEHVGFELARTEGHAVAVVGETEATLTSGDLTARVGRGAPWRLSFEREGRVLTSSEEKSIAYHRVEEGTHLDGPTVELLAAAAGPGARHYLAQQLSLGIGGLVYGLGERFGPLVKNGQSIDIWNADGGTSSEQAYKNLPFYLTNQGYGVLVDHPEHVSFEVGSEAVERVQFAVRGERLQYYVIAGDGPAGILERYTALTGRAPEVPAWSYGTWLSTSFTTEYDEATVNSFIDLMDEHELPVSVFHFDCFWMREFDWCDFEWDARVFPDPVGMLGRLHDRGLKVCVWINPYIGQRSRLFAEAKDRGYLLRRPDGTVWQWDLWQSGMAIVDFTNPEATAWYQSHLRRLLDQGVDSFKTDFGERIPIDVAWADGADPQRMHNWYTQLYNRAVAEVLEERRPGEAVVFARLATVGGQQYPVHWGGDSSSSYASMAETLRGGLSLAFGGFAYWSHDIGGFEGTPDAGVFKRWTAFGMLSTHSRFHGSNSYRVPWSIDDEAVEVTRTFARLKMSLMPYLLGAAREASERGIPVMRPMQLAFPHDPAVAYLDRQYMLGSDLMVAPVFSAQGEVEFYLPPGRWTNYLTGEVVDGGWRRETHGFSSLPLYARGGAVIARGARTDRPDYDVHDGLVIEVFPDGVGEREITVGAPGGHSARFHVEWTETRAVVTSHDATAPWSARIGPTGTAIAAQAERVELTW